MKSEPIHAWVFLHDECPRIGSGYRIVVATVGRLWVRLTSIDGKRCGKVDRQTWTDLLSGGRVLPSPVPRKRKRKH